MHSTQSPPATIWFGRSTGRRTASGIIGSLNVDETIRVLLVDGHDVAREALARYLAQEDDFIVLEPCRHADSAVRAAEQLQPTVVLLGLTVEGRDTFELAGTIQSACPDAGIIFLGPEAGDPLLAQVLAAKARGYVVKPSAVARLPIAIRAVAAGGVYFSEEVRHRLVIDRNGVRLAKP